MRIESDEALRQRLISLIPEGAHYTAEDIANASGDALDAEAEALGTKRLSNHCDGLCDPECASCGRLADEAAQNEILDNGY